MSTFESQLRSLLLADSTVSTLLGGERIYPHMAPQEDVFPYAVYSRVSSNRTIFLNAGPDDTYQPRIQFDLWGDNYGVLRELSEAFRLTLNGFSGSVESVCFGLIALEDESTDFELPSDGQEVPIHRIRQDYMVWVEELL
jgi:hypothetical protein